MTAVRIEPQPESY